MPKIMHNLEQTGVFVPNIASTVGRTDATEFTVDPTHRSHMVGPTETFPLSLGLFSFLPIGLLFLLYSLHSKL